MIEREVTCRFYQKRGKRGREVVDRLIKMRCDNFEVEEGRREVVERVVEINKPGELEGLERGREVIERFGE